MSTKELTCIGCPLGCQITVEFDDEAKKVVSVTGNSCKTGDIYAHKEVTNPTRIVTSSIAVVGGDAARVSCKTQHDIPKSMIFEIMKEIHQTSAKAPLQIGDVLIHDVCHTGVDVVATRNVHAAS